MATARFIGIGNLIKEILDAQPIIFARVCSQSDFGRSVCWRIEPLNKSKATLFCAGHRAVAFVCAFEKKADAHIDNSLPWLCIGTQKAGAE